jgi:hypothetical protein
MKSFQSWTPDISQYVKMYEFVKFVAEMHKVWIIRRCNVLPIEWNLASTSQYKKCQAQDNSSHAHVLVQTATVTQNRLDHVQMAGKTSNLTSSLTPKYALSSSCRRTGNFWYEHRHFCPSVCNKTHILCSITSFPKIVPFMRWCGKIW